MKIRPVILCGGSGTRLWPLSNARTPKQFLKLSGARSMLEETARRVGDPARFDHVLAIGSARHKTLLEAVLPDAEILLEPAARNSAAPIAAACIRSAPDDLLLIMPADHHIEDLDAFHAAVEIGAQSAAKDVIVTFGIEPDHPATGYGYIEAPGEGPVRPAKRFVEKPDLELAQAYLSAGSFYWNAGIFLFRAEVMLAAFRSHAPDILDGVARALHGDGLDRAAFAAVRSQSIDYAVLEKASNIEVVPVSMGWSDLGDFRALHQIIARHQETSQIAQGRAGVTDAHNIFIRSEIGPVAVHGLNDVAVIASQDGILVTRLSKAAGIKDACAAAQDGAALCATPQQRERLGQWLWNDVLPAWSDLAADPATGGFIEELGFDGAPILSATRRGRIAPRQLFTFARAKRLGWNPDGAADRIIDSAFAFLDGPGRAPGGGWAHRFRGDGAIKDPHRDFYDHAFVALAASEALRLGDPRGGALAQEAFQTIDQLFLDPFNGGWQDLETAPGIKRANPHMHLLEASLAHFEATFDPASLRRIETIAALFERWMFDPSIGAVLEEFTSDWRPAANPRIEPGHCYEWAYLLGEVFRLTGRDTASWSRRLIAYAESHGLRQGLALDIIGDQESFRLWPQLERLRALSLSPVQGVDIPAVLEQICERYLFKGPRHGWVDKLGADLEPATTAIPSSMLYHLMTAIAPFAPPSSASASVASLKQEQAANV